jgi:hypothetical protein
MQISLTLTGNLEHVVTPLACIPEQLCCNLDTDRLLGLVCPVFIPTSDHDGLFFLSIRYDKKIQFSINQTFEVIQSELLKAI